MFMSDDRAAADPTGQAEMQLVQRVDLTGRVASAASAEAGGGAGVAVFAVELGGRNKGPFWPQATSSNPVTSRAARNNDPTEGGAAPKICEAHRLFIHGL